MRRQICITLTVLLSLFATAQPDYFTPYKKTSLRMPSVPLIVNDPYISFWSPYNKLTGGTTRHWDNQVKAMDGLLRVDGTTYRFMGAQRSTTLEAIAPMGNKGRWVCKVKYTNPGDNWYEKDKVETGWQTAYGAFGTKSEYDNITTSWGTADIYIRRHINLTAEDLKNDLWIVYSHDDICQMYVNGVQVVSTENVWRQNVKLQLSSKAKEALVEGDNVIAFHVHNTTGGQQADMGLFRNKQGFHGGMKAIAAMADEGAWEAKVTYSSPSSSWTKEEYDDSAWKTGLGAFGSQGEYPNVNTAWNTTNSDVYIRRRITLSEEDLARDLYLIYSHDDVCEGYINGRKVFSTGETWVQNVKYRLSADDKAVLKAGENIIAYHVHNTNGGALADIGMYYNENVEVLPTQNSCNVLATNTYYKFTCGPVTLDLVFTAPMLMDDIQLMSTPINFMSYKVTSNDGEEHDVQFLFATTPELTVDNNMQATKSEVVEVNGINYIKSGSTKQNILGRAGDKITIDWGYLYIPAINGEISIGDYYEMAVAFKQTGKVPVQTASVTSTEESEMPMLAFTRDLGKVTEASSYMMIGYDEVKDIRYMDVDYKGYWARNGKLLTQAFEEYRDNYDDIMTRCMEQDKTIYEDALASGNTKYAELLSGCYRHCIAAHKIFEDNKGNLLFFSKENDSNGCVNTVDLTYPSAPLFLSYNTELMKGMCTSILDYCESKRWGFGFAAHDLGTYPHANNQVYSIRFPDSNGGFAGNMPIEESGNIVILASAISMVDGNTDWADKYWGTLKKWTDYLAENGLDPENQLCTDDFAGHLAHNANLSIKAIMGVAGFALMCQIKGDTDNYNHYIGKAREMAASWVTMAKESTHYKLAFDKSGTWSQKYNMVWDKIWGTELFPATVMKQEVSYYLTKQNTYGLPLDSRESYSKTDWISWTACLASSNTLFARFMDPLYKYANETKSRVPLSDWFRTTNADMVGFRGRSVVGGHWMKVFMDKYLSGAVGIGQTPADLEQNATKDDQWYNLAGQKLGGEPTTPGVYINGGRKITRK